MSRLWRRFAIMFTILTFAALSLIGAAGAASSSPAQPAMPEAASNLATVPAQAQIQATCPANEFCLFENINFGGGRKRYAAGESDSDFRDTHYNNGRVVNDTASSMINNTGRIVVLYRDINLRVGCYAAAAHSADASFTNNRCTGDTTKSTNDNVSSLAVT